MTKKNILPKIYIVLVLLFLYVPMLCVVAYSFNVSKSSAVWNGFTLDWYRKMVTDKNLLSSLWLSVQVAVMTCAVSTVIGTLGGVYVSKLSKKLKLAVTGLIYIPLILPEIVLGIALLMFFSVTPLAFGRITLVLSHSAFCIPYVYFMVTIRLKTIDPAIMEAARDLGAKERQMFRTIILPLVMPAIVSGGLLAFAMSLDDLVISSFVSGPRSMTLPMQIFSMLKLGVTPEINALSSVILFVTFILVGTSQLRERNKVKNQTEEL